MQSVFRLSITLLIFAAALCSASAQKSACVIDRSPATNYIPRPLQPRLTFPSEEPLEYATAAVEAQLRLAADEAGRRNFEKAIRMREETVKRARELSEDRTDEALALQANILDLFLLKREDEGVALAEEVVRKFAANKDTPRQVETLAKAASYLFLINTPKAEALLNRALELGLKETARPRAMTITLFTAGKRIRPFSATWSAKFLNGALELCRKYADGSWEMAGTFYDLSELALETADFAEAELQANKAITLWNELTNKTTAAVAVIDSKLKTTPIEPALSDAYQNQKRELEGNLAHFQSEIGNCELILAAAAHAKGDHKNARLHLARTQEIVRDRSYDPRLRNELLFAAAALETDEGELSCAADDISTVFNSASQAAGSTNFDRDYRDLIRSLTAMGVGAIAQHNYSSAERFLRLAQRIIDQERADESLLAANMLAFGELRARQGRKQDAQEDLRLAEEIYEQRRMPLRLADVKVVRADYGVGSDEQRKKDFAEAKEAVTRLAPKSVLMAKVLLGISYSLKDTNEYRLGEQLNVQAADILRNIAPKSFGLAAAEHNLMWFAKNAGNLAEAERLGQLSWDHAAQIAPEFAGEEAGQIYSGLFAGYGTSLAEVQISRKRFAEAFITLERTRSRRLLQLLSQKRELSSKQWLGYQLSLSEKYRAEVDFVRLREADRVAGLALDDLRKKKASQREIDDAADRLRELDHLTSSAESNLAMRTAAADYLWRDLFSNLTPNVEPASFIQQHKAIKPGTVFILYSQSRDSILVMALKGGSSEVVSEQIDPGKFSMPGYPQIDSKDPKERLLAGISKFRDLLEAEPDSRALPQLTALGQALFDHLFPGRIRSLVLNSDRVVISPDSVLWQVPFAALVAGPAADTGARYLGLLKPISYVQSLAVYYELQSASAPRPQAAHLNALVIGNPKFASARGGNTVRNNDGNMDQSAVEATETVWAGLRSRSAPPAALPNSEFEASEIACVLGASPVLGTDATEPNIRERMAAADVIHFATHGVVDRSQALSSGLLLTPPPEDPLPEQTEKDGALQAWEVFSQLRLHADLVVLSACETALGQSVRGEGIIGLTRAFQYAGARSVIATQWQVRDRSTSELMTSFYRYLGARKMKDEAMRLAMLKLSSVETTAHPHYWAAFTLTGNADNLMMPGVAASCK